MNEDLRESSRPNSMTSNSSFHSTQDEFDVCAGDKDDASERREEGDGRGGGREEVRLLRQALESVQLKLLETRKENRSLQSQLKPEQDEFERVREKGREEELMESLAELQAKLTDTQERCHQAVEELEELRGQVGREGGETTENQDVQRLEQEVGQLKAQLGRSGSEQEEAARRMRELEEALARAEEERRRVVEEKQKEAELEELYKEAQEEIKMLQVGAWMGGLTSARLTGNTCPAGGSEGDGPCGRSSERLRGHEGGAQRGHFWAAAPPAGTVALLQRDQESAQRGTEAAGRGSAPPLGGGAGSGAAGRGGAAEEAAGRGREEERGRPGGGPAAEAGGGDSSTGPL